MCKCGKLRSETLVDPMKILLLETTKNRGEWSCEAPVSRDSWPEYGLNRNKAVDWDEERPRMLESHMRQILSFLHMNLSRIDKFPSVLKVSTANLAVLCLSLVL